MGLMRKIRAGRICDEMLTIAREEEVDSDTFKRRLSEGKAVILRNAARENGRPVGVGEGLSTKINANVGTSSLLCDLNCEMLKAKAAVKYGADALMDLSTSGNLDEIRGIFLKEIPLPIGTVPIYQAAVEAIRKYGALINLTEDDALKTIDRHAHDGVDFMTIHAGITKDIVEKLKVSPRLGGIVSRGGTFLASWMLHHGKENPYLKNFDYILETAKEFDFTISLGDALRPGCIADASDWFQFQELLIVQKLVEKCWNVGVQVMVEGPGHLPLNQVEANVTLQKKLCKGAPFYVLGPVVTDIGAGYDHIVSAIGGALAAMYGADFLCYVTPSEHLGLPTVEDVREGVVAAKIAAHCADIVKLGEKKLRIDYAMTLARAKLDWETQYKLSVDPEKAKGLRERVKTKTETCSMCGEYCVYKLLPIRGKECL